MNLYDIAENFRVLAELESSGDYDEQTIADTLEALEGDLQHKAENIGKLVKMLEREADACDLEAIRLKDRAAALRKRADHVTAYLHSCMRLMQVKRVETPLFNVVIRRLPPVVELDEELLPKKWLVEKVDYRPDRMAIKDAIQQGQEIRGARLVTEREKLYIK